MKNKSLYVLHDPSIKNEGGDTCAMLWIVFVRTLPPQKIRHDASIRDKYGETCADIWKKCVGKPVPPELL